MRNVLIVSYYFPPFNSIASIRVSQLAYWLSKLGWNAVILTVDYRKPAEDPLDQLVDDASIIRIDGNDPFERLRSIIKRFMAKPGAKKDPNIQGTLEETVENKKIKWLRKLNPVSNVRLPDNTIWWQNKAVKTGLVYLAKHPVDIIFSSCGPPSSHIVASKLSKMSGTPWVADYRDLWSLNHMIKRPWPLQNLEEKFERCIIEQAEHITTVSHDLSKKIQSLIRRKDIVTVIHNGFDNDYHPNSRLQKSEKLTISYTGNIYPHQDPRPFIKAIKRLKDANILSSQNSQALFYGINLDPIRPLSEAFGVSDIVKCRGNISHAESLQRQMASDILLMLGWHSSGQKGIVTGKLFEYLGADRPILCTGPGSDEIETILKETQAGQYCCSDNDTLNTLNGWVEEWQSGGVIAFQPNRDRVSDFSRERLSKKLSNVLGAVLKAQSH